MELKQKERDVLESLDILSQEMAQFVVQNNKGKLITEIEEDIIKSEKKKKDKEKNNSNIIILSNESSENYDFLSKKENSSYNNNNESYNKNNNSNVMNFHNSNKKIKKVCFIEDNKTNNNEELNKEINNLNKSKGSLRSNNVEKINENININDVIEKTNRNKIIIKNDKQDIEITLSPIYGYQGEEEEINYYDIKSYIDKTRKKMLAKKSTRKNNYSTNFEEKNYKSRLSKDNKKNLSKNEINSLLPKDKNNSFNKIVNDDKNIERKKIKTHTLKEKILNFNLKDEQSQNENKSFNLDKDIENIDNISEKEEEKSRSLSKENSKTFSSSNIIYYSDASLSSNANHKINNLLINYFKNGRKSKYNHFLEKQLKLKRFTENRINKLKREKELKEYKNNYFSPRINSFSLQIVNNKGNYIPLFKRAIELESERRMKRLIGQKRENNNFIINSNCSKRTIKQINDFFCAQMNWKDKVNKKNENLKNELKQKLEQISDSNNSEIKINHKSEMIIQKKRKQNSSAIYDSNQNNSSFINNSAIRLYKDYEIRQKKLRKLKRELTPSFKPSINQSPLLFIKNKRNKYDSIKDKIEEVKNDNSYNYKYNSNIISFKNNSGNFIKWQKSRNIKGNAKNSSISSRFFNKKENNMKSTAVDSKNTKSLQKISSEINNTKLEKIKENEDSKEENSNTNKNSEKDKSYKNNVNNNTPKEKNDINNNSHNSNKDKNNETIKSKSSRNKSNTSHNINNTKNIYNKSEVNKGNENNNDINNNNTDSKNKNSNSSHNNINKSIEENSSKKNLKISNNIENNIDKDNEKDIIITEENKEKYYEKEVKNQNIEMKKNENKISPTFDAKKKDGVEPKMNQKRNNNSSNRNLNINKNKIRKSTITVNKRKTNFTKIPNRQKFNRHRSLITKKSSELFITNKFKEKYNQSEKLVNNAYNQNDSIEINNLDNEKFNYFNDFISNKSTSKENIKNSNNIIKDSFNIEGEIFNFKKDSFFDVNFQKEKTIQKEDEEKVVQKYKFNCSDTEVNGENEESEDNNDKKNEENNSLSWIKKLDEISKNEEIKTEREKEEINKKKKNGASTTRSQTNRKNTDREKEINGNYNEENLYMLNSRNSSSTGKLNPFTFTAQDELFYKFFLKNK